VTQHSYKYKLYIASVIGEVLEWYDFSLYGFLGAVFATLFFPPGTFLSGLIGVYTVFAIGFISRPFGGLLFGWLADRAGRKAAFSISLFSMALATFLMGCLPTYNTIGIAAPILLLILRLLQGFSCGGEFSISMIFLSEHATKRNYFFSGSLTWMGVMLGALLASLIILLLSQHEEFFIDFGWRIPFFIGGVIALAALYLRLKMPETPVFSALQEKQQAHARPCDFLKACKKEMLAICLLNAPVAALSYVGIPFIPTFLAKFVGVPFNTSSLLNTILIIMLIFLIPMTGIVADKCKAWALYFYSIILLIVTSIPVYYLFAHSEGPIGYACAIIMIAIPSAMIKSVSPGLSVALSPLKDRAVTMSVSYNITYSLIGGTAPLLMSMLIEKTGILLWPAFYILFFCMLSGSLMLLIKKYQ